MFFAPLSTDYKKTKGLLVVYMSVGCQEHLDIEGIRYLLYLQNQHTKEQVFLEHKLCIDN